MYISIHISKYIPYQLYRPLYALSNLLSGIFEGIDPKCTLDNKYIKKDVKKEQIIKDIQTHVEPEIKEEIKEIKPDIQTINNEIPKDDIQTHVEPNTESNAEPKDDEKIDPDNKHKIITTKHIGFMDLDQPIDTEKINKILNINDEDQLTPIPYKDTDMKKPTIIISDRKSISRDKQDNKINEKDDSDELDVQPNIDSGKKSKLGFKIKLARRKHKN